MPIQVWTAPLNVPTPAADGTPLASSVTLTDISPLPNYIVPAELLYRGMMLRVRARGRFSTTGTPTLLLGVYVGGVAGTAIATTGAITTTSGVTNVPWSLDMDIECRAVGTAGTVLGIGTVTGISGTVGVSTVPAPASAPATVTWDTTAAKILTVGAQWGTNSASNTITCHTFVIEALG